MITQAEFTEKYGATFATNSAFSFAQSNGMLTASSISLTTDDFTLPLGQTLTDDILEFKARFKTDNVAASGGYNFVTFATGDDDGNYVELLRINSGGNSFSRPQGNSDDHGWVGPSLTADDEGFYSVNIIITNEIPDSISNKDGKNFYVTVNDMNANGTKKSSHTIKKATSLSKLRISVLKNQASKDNESTIIFDTLSYKKFAPEVVSVSAPAGSISPKVGIINVAFNTAVDVTTIADGITFEDANGNPVPNLQITPAADNKSVAVTFDDLDITDYVLSVTSDLKSAVQDAFTPFSMNYTVVIEPLEITDISHKEGTISPATDKIEITFNNPVEPSTIANSITFKKENGKDIDGNVAIEIGDLNNKVNLLIDGALKGNYILTVNESLKDIYGDNLDQAMTYKYTAAAMMNADFTNLEKRQYMHDEIQAMSGASVPASSNFIFNGVDGGLEVTEPANAQGSSVTFNNAGVFKTGELIYNFVLKRVSNDGDGIGDNQFRINAVTSKGSSALITSNILQDKLMRPTGLGSWYSRNQADLVADKDGYLNFSVVFTDMFTDSIPESVITPNSKYVMYIYDNNKNGELAFTQIYNASSLSDIAGISFSTYKSGAAKPYESAIIIKSIEANLKNKYTCGDNLDWEFSDGTLTINGTGAMYNSKMPWYSFKDDIKNVVIDDGVTTIGSNAFLDCINLTSISIPDSITSIGSYAFSGCLKLTAIDIPDNVAGIANYAFNNCIRLTNINIPDNVTSISEYTFYGCSSLTSIVIPDGVASIGSDAFYGCSSLTSIDIPDSVTNIGDSAFYGCSSLTSIVIPDNVTNIGSYAFYGCNNLTSIVIPDGVTNISSGLFQGCSNLTSIVIPDNVTNIGSYVFLGCSSLISIVIPDNVTNIGSYTFSNCIRLTNINIPDNVTSIGDHAFYGCRNLTSIDVPDGVTNIGDHAFYGCNSLTSINIPDSVTSIGSYAFYGCSSLTSVILSDYITEIATATFDNCPKLEVVFYTGDETEWHDILIYGRNNNLENANIVCNATKKTYQFITNCDETIPAVTDYAIFTAPQASNAEMTLQGWYDNEDLSGDAVTFPYYGSSTTLYAKWLAPVPEVPSSYTINSITLKDLSGSSLSHIPDNDFLATISFTNTGSDSDAMLVLAQYTDDGVFKGLMYVNIEDAPAGSTMKITLPVDNTNGSVASLKAFIWESFSSMTPIGNIVSFPAE